MKLAIAGCGRIASVHYEAIEQLIQDKNYNVSISALIDISEINAKHFQQKHQIDSDIFTDFEDALNQVEFDSVLICAPHDFHETLAIRSFENGKHVLLEKPMAHDLNSALKILKCSKSSGNVFMTFFRKRRLVKSSPSGRHSVRIPAVIFLTVIICFQEISLIKPGGLTKKAAEAGSPWMGEPIGSGR